MVKQKINLLSAAASLGINALLFLLVSYLITPSLVEKTKSCQFYLIDLTQSIIKAKENAVVDTIKQQKKEFSELSKVSTPEVVKELILKPAKTEPKLVESDKMPADQAPAYLPTPRNEDRSLAYLEVQSAKEAISFEVSYSNDHRIKSFPQKTIYAARHSKLPPRTGQSDILAGYQNAIRDKILSARIYPLSARKRGEKGVVVLSFLVSKDGFLKDVKLKKSSKYKILDQAAVETIQKASPFLPLPSDLDKDELWLKLAISYVLD